jgi:transcription initiation factor TFIIIB Brf1 subunit/transcription initiation factor TFIIB
MSSHPTLEIVSVSSPKLHNKDLTSYTEEPKYEVKSSNLARKYNRISNKVTKSIQPDMKLMRFSETIKNEAEKVFQILKQGTRRKNNRNLMIFFCIYTACINLGIKKDSDIIAKEVGINPNKAVSAISRFSESQTGYSSINRLVKPSDLIPDHCDKFNLSDEIVKSIVNFAEEIEEKGPEILERSPKTVSKSMIRYYFTINGISITDADFSQTIGLSFATIRENMKLISLIYNSE